jgi:predicted glycosyltransferase
VRDDNDERSPRSNLSPEGVPQSTIRYTTRPGGRVMFYSHDTYGLGHIRRTLCLLRALLDRAPKVEALLATGSPVLEQLPVPRRACVLPLKPVVKVAAERYEARDRSLDARRVVAHRASQLLEGAQLFRPDVLVVDHAPLGMKGELVPTLQFLRASVPSARIVLGLRDILDEPEVVRRTWREQGVYGALERYYDWILVYGERHHFPVDREYALPATLRHKLEFTGYLRKHDPVRPADAARRDLGIPPRVPLVLATVGGGGDGSELLMATVEAFHLLKRKHGDLHALLVTGPLMEEPKQRDLRAAIAGLPQIRLTSFLPDLASAIASANVVVAMAGYNTVTEILALGRPAVLVPRVAPRQEQLIRARLLARDGLVRVLEPDAMTPARLADAIERSIRKLSRAPAARTLLSMSGTECAVAAICTQLNSATGHPVTSPYEVDGRQLPG